MERKTDEDRDPDKGQLDRLEAHYIRSVDRTNSLLIRTVPLLLILTVLFDYNLRRAEQRELDVELALDETSDQIKLEGRGITDVEKKTRADRGDLARRLEDCGLQDQSQVVEGLDLYVEDGGALSTKLIRASALIRSSDFPDRSACVEGVSSTPAKARAEIRAEYQRLAKNLRSLDRKKENLARLDEKKAQ